MGPVDCRSVVSQRRCLHQQHHISGDAQTKADGSESNFAEVEKCQQAGFARWGLSSKELHDLWYEHVDGRIIADEGLWLP